MYKKGQYFSFDAIVGSVIFVLALLALLSYWHSVRSILDFQASGASKEAVRISNALLSPPDPLKFKDCSSVKSLGFALDWSDRRLNEEILKCKFSNSDLRKFLGTKYNLRIEIRDLKSSVDSPKYVLGLQKIPSDSKEVEPLKRRATVYNQKTREEFPALIDLYLYQSR